MAEEVEKAEETKAKEAREQALKKFKEAVARVFKDNSTAVQCYAVAENVGNTVVYRVFLNKNYANALSKNIVRSGRGRGEVRTILRNYKDSDLNGIT